MRSDLSPQARRGKNDAAPRLMFSSIKQQAADGFAAAAGAASDHDDLAACRLDARERLMLAPCVTTRRFPLPVHLSMSARAPAVRASL